MALCQLPWHTSFLFPTYLLLAGLPPSTFSMTEWIMTSRPRRKNRILGFIFFCGSRASTLYKLRFEGMVLKYSSAELAFIRPTVNRHCKCHVSKKLFKKWTIFWISSYSSVTSFKSIQLHAWERSASWVGLRNLSWTTQRSLWVQIMTDHIFI